MRKCFFLMLFVLTLVSLAHAAQKSRIELTDGSTLDGEVDSYSNGKYTVKSPTLGILKIEKSKVRAIRSANPTAESSKKTTAVSDVTTGKDEIQKIQGAITGNPDVMKAIPGLLASPDFQALLEDPEIMNAAKSMDVQALMANEKIVKAANNPAVKKIGQKIKEKNN